MSPPNRDTRQAVEAAADLGTALKEFKADIGDLQATARRNRRLITILAALLVVVLALCVVVGLVAVQAREASSATARATARQVTTCEAGNATRRDQRELWNYVFAVTIPALGDPALATPESVERRAQAAATFNTYLDKIAVQRDCSAR